jgi:hypothetical protein
MNRRSAHVLTFLIPVAALALLGDHGTLAQGCGFNAIVCENMLAGAPASEWDVSTPAGDATIQGFATSISVNRGQTVRFKIKSTASSYRLDIYRMGYYDGMGARKIATVTPSAGLPQTQPACLTTPATGLIDCGNWAESASWAVPATATSGIYFAKLVRLDTGGSSHIIFVVRDDSGASDLLFQTSDTTWQAYNSYGGNSLYTGAPAGRAYKVSYNRPLIGREMVDGPRESSVFNAEYPMVRWLEANGYNVSYSSGVDTDRVGAELLEHKVFLSVGHDEYWSGQQRANVEAARNAGVHLAFLSGNEVFWKTRWENDASGNAYRTLVCYKETIADDKIDPTAAWTGTWRDPRFSPPADGGRPENALTGTAFVMNGTRSDSIVVPEVQGKLRFWRNTSVQSLSPGQSATMPAGTLGYEWDLDPDNGWRPAGLLRLSSTTVTSSSQVLLNYGSQYGAGTVTHNLTLYRHSGGALVFGAGTVQWSWGLDAAHDRPGTPSDLRMQQATVNLLADMGTQPQSLRAGLIAAVASSDTVRPTSAITAPAAGATVQSGTPVTIQGTASDQGGGVVGAVEVSVDGGVTWHPATGRNSWSYVWTPAALSTTTRQTTVRSRAVDDSGNVETPAAGVTVSVAPLGGLVAAYGFSEGSGTSVTDISGTGNTGTISGATWTAAGRFGQALSFDGVNDLVSVNDANSLDLTNGLTLEAWINPTALSGWQSVILKPTTNSLSYGLYANGSLPRPSLTLGIGSDIDTPGVSPLPLNTWTHLAATFDGTTARLYINGVLITSKSAAGNLPVSTRPVGIGGNSLWGEYVKGTIDEVRIYNRPLNVEEIQHDMNTAVGGTPLPDTTAPAASVSSPVAGAVVAATITVTATASDNIGVSGVQFLLDGAALGTEDPTSPYSISWNTTTVGDGSHTLSARARDAAGNLGTAANVPVTVANAPDSVPPTVSITAPAAGSTQAGTVTITANASDNVAVAGVTFFVDGTPIGAEDQAAPWSTSWNTASVTNASHTLTARARDASNNLTTSAAVAVTVNNTAPTTLVAAFAFDEGSGATVTDVSGKGNNGTITGATWGSAGKYGKALLFNGTSNWVTVADANTLDLTTGMTIEAWVNPSILSGWRQVILKEATNVLAYGLYAHNNAPHPATTIQVGGLDREAAGTAALPLNTWTHLAATFDGSTLRLYVNATQVQSLAISGSLLTSAGPLRIGGNAIWGEYFGGLIDEVRVHNVALTQTQIQTDMNSAVGPVLPPDTTPPTVSLTSPAAGPVAGTLTVAANASDAGGVASVEFRVNGASLGAPDTTAPYQAFWNTGALTNGTVHSVTAVARDQSGNQTTSAPVSVTVSNPTDTASVGQWSAPFELGFVAVHMVLMNTGKVLMYPAWQPSGPLASVFNPATGTLTSTPNTTSLIFCSGHSTLADGRVLVAGGWDGPNGALGLAHTNIFNPATQQWSRTADMSYRRWYPSATTMGDGRVLVTSGATTCDACIADVPEIFNPVTMAWTQLTGARLSIPYYPLSFLLPNGKVLITGSTDLSGPARTLDVSTQSWAVVDPIVFDGASAAMYLPGKVLQSGTASDLVVKPSATTTGVLDMTAASPAWRQTAPMAFARAYHNLTILPDGSVLAVGGGNNTSGVDISTSVFAAERWSPVTEKWTTMARGALGRLYHSTSLLMPDGRVLVAGGGDYSTAVNQTEAEWYSPPYLFKGARPAITGSPAVVNYGTSFFVATPDGPSIASAALVRPGSTTHAFDEDQRYVPLTFSQTTGGLTMQAPANANLAPPGYYMLFILNTAGVPSIAPMVRFPAPYEDAIPPSAPGTLTATGSIGAAALSWTASTDNIGVVGYDLHRSTVSGFTANAANRIAQPAGTSYNNSPLTAGTYYYRVIARDVAGNVSAPSNQATATVTSDTTAPTVTLTSPAPGATVSTTITVTANASDNVGVAGVQFLLDGAALGVEDTASPYSVSWDTRTVANGAHTLSARARDGAGNQTTTPAVSVTVNNTAPPPPSGLIAAYGFNENTGTTTADATGTGHIGTLTGAVWAAAGKTGSAVSFDGVDDWVSVNDANDLDLTTGMTLEAWVRPAALGGWNSVIMKEHGIDTLAYGLYANDNAPYPTVTIRVGVLDYSAPGTAPVPIGQWTHLAATYDGATLRMYVNGVQVGSRAQTGNMVVSTRALRFGGNGVWGEYFNGLIDDVRIYNRALTATEIQTDMATAVQ